MEISKSMTPILAKTFCLTSLFILVNSNGLLGDKCVSSIEGVALVQHTYKSFIVRDMFVCYYHCKDDSLCQSLNFHRDNNLCELNNRTRSVRSLNFVPDAAVIYLDNPFRAFLGSSPLLPGESCREIKTGSEGIAPSGRYWLQSVGSDNQTGSVYCDMENEVTVECATNPCQNGGTCDYQGEGKYTCRCSSSFSGIHCEEDIDACASNPCLFGGTCTDTVSGFNCTCPASMTGMRCELSIGTECDTYTTNNDADRSVLNPTNSQALCDDKIVEGWYRFNGSAGTKLPITCVPKSKCGTHATGWLQGTHPTPQEGVVDRSVCFNWNGNCCHWSVAIKVRNCGLFYVYNLVQTASCYLRYCVTN